MTATPAIPRDLRGGDHWYAARAQTVCFRAAAVVHRLGEAGSHDVANACGISVAKAYEALVACCRRPSLYHIIRASRGRFTPIDFSQVEATRHDPERRAERSHREEPC